MLVLMMQVTCPRGYRGSGTSEGKRGTILQPAIDLIQQAEDFPKKGPILIITDGYCDKLTIKRDHAYILPKGNDLPFSPKGPVFRIN